MRRASYFDDQLLEAVDLNFTQNSKKYSILELTRGLTKTPGVVINSLNDLGLKVNASGVTFSVNPGRAFDASGNEIVVPSEVTIADPGKSVLGDSDYRPANLLPPRQNILITDLTTHTLKVSIGFTETNDPTMRVNDNQGLSYFVRTYNSYIITQTHSGDIPSGHLLLAEIVISNGLVSAVTDKRPIFALPHVVPKKQIGNTVTVAKSGADFTSVREAVNSVTSAAATNPYIVLVYPGVYTETSTITLKPYVNIVGFSPSSTIIKIQDGSTVFTTSGGVVSSVAIRSIRAESSKADHPVLNFTGNPIGTNIQLFNCEFASLTPLPPATLPPITSPLLPVMYASSNAVIQADRCQFISESVGSNNLGAAIVVFQGVHGRIVLRRCSVIGIAGGRTYVYDSFDDATPAVPRLVYFPDTNWKFNARNCYFKGAKGGMSFFIARPVGSSGQYQFSLTDCTIKGIIFNYAAYNTYIGDVIQILRCTFPESAPMDRYGISGFPRITACIYRDPFPGVGPVDGTLQFTDTGVVDLGTNFLHGDLNLFQKFDVI